jgi:hypothetical protein
VKVSAGLILLLVAAISSLAAYYYLQLPTKPPTCTPAETSTIAVPTTVSQQIVVHSLLCLVISWLPTICLSTVSPSPLTAVASR